MGDDVQERQKVYAGEPGKERCARRRTAVLTLLLCSAAHNNKLETYVPTFPEELFLADDLRPCNRTLGNG